MDAGHHLRSIWRLLLYVCECVCVFVKPMRVTLLGSDLKLFLICITLRVSIQLLTQRCNLQASFNNGVVLFVKALMGLYFAWCVCFCRWVSETMSVCVHTWVRARQIIAETHTAKLAIRRLSLSLSLSLCLVGLCQLVQRLLCFCLTICKHKMYRLASCIFLRVKYSISRICNLFLLS